VWGKCRARGRSSLAAAPALACEPGHRRRHTLKQRRCGLRSSLGERLPSIAQSRLVMRVHALTFFLCESIKLRPAKSPRRPQKTSCGATWTGLTMFIRHQSPVLVVAFQPTVPARSCPLIVMRRFCPRFAVLCPSHQDSLVVTCTSVDGTWLASSQPISSERLCIKKSRLTWNFKVRTNGYR
jgi:hypothetical protein